MKELYIKFSFNGAHFTYVVDTRMNPELGNVDFHSLGQVIKFFYSSDYDLIRFSDGRPYVPICNGLSMKECFCIAAAQIIESYSEVHRENLEILS